MFGEEIKNILPVILSGKSDSASMDMVVELLLMTGRSLPEVMMMLVPEDHGRKIQKCQIQKKHFTNIIPALWNRGMALHQSHFTDGNYLGAVLDRNGLRPSRLYRYKRRLCYYVV